MEIKTFYPEKDIHIQWPGVTPLGYHYSAVKGPLIMAQRGYGDSNCIYYNYDGKPEKIDIYGINFVIPFDAINIEVFLKCKAKAGSAIPLDPNDSHFIMNIGYNDGIINEVYASKDFVDLTSEWEDYSFIVALSQPHYFHHYHSLDYNHVPTPGREEEFWLYHEKPEIGECEHTIIHHPPPPATLSSQQILNEINYISLTGILVDPTAWIYVASLAVEVIYI